MVGESIEDVGAGLGGGSSGQKMPTLEEYGTNLTKLAEEVFFFLTFGLLYCISELVNKTSLSIFFSAGKTQPSCWQTGPDWTCNPNFGQANEKQPLPNRRARCWQDCCCRGSCTAYRQWGCSRNDWRKEGLFESTWFCSMLVRMQVCFLWTTGSTQHSFYWINLDSKEIKCDKIDSLTWKYPSVSPLAYIPNASNCQWVASSCQVFLHVPCLRKFSIFSSKSCSF